MNRAIIGNKILDVVSPEQFYNNKPAFADSDIVIEVDRDGTRYSLPYRPQGTMLDRPGVYNCGVVDIFVYPVTEEEKEKYAPEIIDFNHVVDLKDFKEKKEKLNSLEKDMLQTTGKDNVFAPPLLETDAPEMRAIKTAIIEKNIDLDKYADRFGANYPNDKRKFKDDNITLYLIKRACECLDMKAQLILEDRSPDVPNPIGRRIVVDLTSGFDDDEN
jgi:hypothetical protein